MLYFAKPIVMSNKNTILLIHNTDREFVRNPHEPVQPVDTATYPLNKYGLDSQRYEVQHAVRRMNEHDEL